MKIFYLFFYLSIFLFSCERAKSSEWYEFCVVKAVKTKWKHGGLLPEKTYSIKTSCGYTIVSSREVSVGDTIQVKVISYRKEDRYKNNRQRN
jgi:hypothetical protein